MLAIMLRTVATSSRYSGDVLVFDVVMAILWRYVDDAMELLRR